MAPPKQDAYCSRVIHHFGLVSGMIDELGCFILATNETDTFRLKAEELLSTYKDQQKVERGFRFLKAPHFLASTLFLRSVSRIMSLAAVMTLCLLVYAALEYRIRTTPRRSWRNLSESIRAPSCQPHRALGLSVFYGHTYPDHSRNTDSAA